jgi:hypothetical protein
VSPSSNFSHQLQSLALYNKNPQLIDNKAVAFSCEQETYSRAGKPDCPAVRGTTIQQTVV